MAPAWEGFPGHLSPIGHNFGPSYAFFRTSNVIIWTRGEKKSCFGPSFWSTHILKLNTEVALK
jgi:hypothetical protein